jgi:hypothetical protein
MAGSKRTLTGSRKKVRDVPKAEESFTDDSNSEAEEDSEIDDSLANHKDTRNKKRRKGGNQIEDTNTSRHNRGLHPPEQQVHFIPHRAMLTQHVKYIISTG